MATANDAVFMHPAFSWVKTEIERRETIYGSRVRAGNLSAKDHETFLAGKTAWGTIRNGANELLLGKAQKGFGQINQPILISKLRVELDKIEGVQTVKDVKITNKFNTADGYSGNVYDIDQALKEGVVYPSLDPSIFEIKYLDKDIKGRTIAL